MGSCFSKKRRSTSKSPLLNPPEKGKCDAQFQKRKSVEEPAVKKELFVIKHRISHERQRSGEVKMEPKNVEEAGSASVGSHGGVASCGGMGTPMRALTCTKEEVDAILIQCGRLSRSSSAAKIGEDNAGKCSGSKRSYDFDQEPAKSDGNNAADGDEDAVAMERENRRRDRSRQSRGRRRTLSREREKDQTSQNRSGSRERSSNSSGGGRRVSRSPGRRSESPIPNTSSGGVNSTASHSSRPGKMVSVPATVTSLSLDKSLANVSGSSDANPVMAVTRIHVKRNAGASSPRNRSPARLRAGNDNHQPSLSRSNSKKADNSPFRRNPLAEIDNNIISQGPPSKKHNNITSKNYYQEVIIPDVNKELTSSVALNVISPGPENLKLQQGITRSRSTRLSRDLDMDPEVQDTKISSYTALLLEDIQNFHQKTAAPVDFALPACLTKACSILEAVADLNSSTGSNLSTTLMEDRRRNNPVAEKGTEIKLALKSIPIGNMKFEMEEPIMESMIVADVDLMEPSFHKYVSAKRGTDESGEQESSGSNSIVGSQQQMGSSSSREPNTAQSTDRWTSSAASRADSRKSEAAEGGKRSMTSKKKDSAQQQHNGLGRTRNGTRTNYAATQAAST